MKTLILYATKYGSVEKVANLIAEKIPNCILKNVKEKNDFQLNDFERIIIGGSIYIGKIQQQITQFCQENKETLLQKEVGIFICAMNTDNEMQLNHSFQEELLKHSKIAAILGGEFHFEKMNFLERTIVKKIAKISESVSKLDFEKIERFCETMKSNDVRK
jgi:menaquinone-dependent protoporphyrinogen oxidase